MQYCLFDDKYRDEFLPLAFTKPVSELRIGILTIREKWEKVFGAKINSWKTQDYLSNKYTFQEADQTIYLNGLVCPLQSVAKMISELKDNQGIACENRIVAIRTSNQITDFEINSLPEVQWIQLDEKLMILSNVWELFTYNAEQIQFDFDLITKGRISEPISTSCFVSGAQMIFIEEDAKITNASLNAENGPIYIGANAEVMEGSLIRGPFVLGDHSVVHMGAKIYGPVTVGPHSKVGGELNNVNIQGFSNKGHDGFLGSSVIGEWCNLGADSNTSNLKNSYAEVKLWNYPTGRFGRTGLQFCGLIMGDHSKCGINVMFNAGTIVGVCCNIYGSGYPRNFVPSFTEGSTQRYQVNKLYDVFTTSSRVMKRRNLELNANDQHILTEVFELTKKYRKY